MWLPSRLFFNVWVFYVYTRLACGVCERPITSTSRHMHLSYVYMYRLGGVGGWGGGGAGDWWIPDVGHHHNERVPRMKVTQGQWHAPIAYFIVISPYLHIPIYVICCIALQGFDAFFFYLFFKYFYPHTKLLLDL